MLDAKVDEHLIGRGALLLKQCKFLEYFADFNISIPSTILYKKHISSRVNQFVVTQTIKWNSDRRTLMIV